MKLAHQKMLIPNDGTDPFVNCELERKQYGDILTSVVNSSRDGFVMALDNKWGTGKNHIYRNVASTSIKLWV
ncbi:MAG: hypothetical protein JJ975_04015 [Bacteroidia bacterium]|nr:hypothetical protein [Bacteroidia bacterium]